MKGEEGIVVHTVCSVQEQSTKVHKSSGTDSVTREAMSSYLFLASVMTANNSSLDSSGNCSFTM